jgi:cytochrome b561
MPEQAVSDVARVAAGDDRMRYDNPAMTLHWATAVLVISMWLIAQAWGFAPRHAPIRGTLHELHISLGLCLIVVLAARIFWRIGPSRRVPPADTGLVELAARAVHYFLYALLIAVVTAGVFNTWLQADPMTFFWLFTIPPAMAKNHALGHTVNTIHEWIANTIIILAGLHAAAALFHHYVLGDDVLLRMVPGRRARRAERATPAPPGAPKNC